MMNISEQGLELIRQHEGCRFTAYRDSVGMLTIGYGHTKGVQENDTCTAEQAAAWLSEDVKTAENCVNSAVSVEVTHGEFDALVSFTFNLGCAALRNSTLLRKLNAEDFEGAAAEFHKWNHANGVVLAGLTARREAEREMFEATA
jgi:lysozyme